MSPFMFGARALSSLISFGNAISRNLGIPRGSFLSDQFRRFGPLSGVERCSSYGLFSNNDYRVPFRRLPGTETVFQRRHFLGCGDGEEGGGDLSKIYEERIVLGYSPEQIFNVVAAVGLVKESLKFSTKYLSTFSNEDAQILDEAKEEAVRAVIEFVKVFY